MPTRTETPECVADVFDIDNPADFYRWATPILLHIIKYGKVMRAPPFKNQLHREVFRKVIMQMMTWGFWRVSEGLGDEDLAVVDKWLNTRDTDETPEVDWVLVSWEEILYKWYAELEKGV